MSDSPALTYLILFLLISSTYSAGLDPADLSAMEDLSTAISGATVLDWTPSTSPCTWPHVTCIGTRVTSIQIGKQTLNGRLPTSISDLTSLTRLELQSNNLSGPLPSLGNLSLLQTLILHNNKFTSMPSDFFSGLTSLRSVSLDKNPFQPWEIPPSLKQATGLVNFSANSANVSDGLRFFSGENFPALFHLGLAYNLLKGSLPSELGSLPVRSLWVNNQQGEDGVLSGSLDVIQNMTGAVQLWFNSNNFSGGLPDFGKLEYLRDLNLRDNRLSGVVPESLLALKSLRKLGLTNNLLQGPVPEFHANVTVDLNDGSESFCLETAGKCDSRVNSLLAVVKNFGYQTMFAENWKGNDPCGGGGKWLGIGCDNIGNITVINFKNMGLAGTISPEFSSFSYLQKLILAGNNLTGAIPESLTDLLDLIELDVSDNLLNGKVPTFRKKVSVITGGNPDIEKNTSDDGGGSVPGTVSSLNSTNSTNSGNDHRSPSRRIGVIVGSVIGGGIALVVIIALLIFYSRKKKKISKSSGKVQSPTTVIEHSDPDLLKPTIVESTHNIHRQQQQQHMMESGTMVISIHVLRSVTDNFKETKVLGRGGFGTVYKGELHDGTNIAVKRMESGVMESKGLTEFQSEITVLTKVRHRNLVSLLGYCLDGNERILVYEYMPQGTLSRYLFDWKDEGLRPLDWKKRVSVALDVARGVEYLHGLAHQSFIHRDLKPSNILLGDDLKAKVADFGLVRLAPDGKCSVETRLAGTFGYLAPEYAVTGRVTTKADVFSFGVILMELITGRKALDDTLPEESVHLVTWFKRMQLNEESSNKAIDPTLELDEESLGSVRKVSELAGHCCAREPYQRPDMGHAVNVLSSLAEMWRPSDPDSEEIYGIDLDMSLPQALKKWQEFEEHSRCSDDASSSSFLASVDNTQTSIPTRPSGFADSFTSVDGR